MCNLIRRFLVLSCAITWAASPAGAQEAGTEDDPLGSRLFFGSTGRALKPGEGYLSITSLFLPAMQVGITDRFSFGVGLPFYGAAKSLYLTPKLQIYRSQHTHVSAGLVHVFVRDFLKGGFAHATATMGSADSSVTFGGGWLYASDDDSRGGAPMFKLGAERRLSRRTKFISENYITPAGVIATAGTRFTRTRSSWDLAAIVIIGRDGPVGPPGLVINFYWHQPPGAAARTSRASGAVRSPRQ